MAEICFACLAPAMVKTGEWDRAVEVCRAILDSGDAPAAARAVAAAELGVVYVLRGATRRATVALRQSGSSPVATKSSGWRSRPPGLAQADALEGRVEDAVVRARTSSIGSQAGRSVTTPSQRCTGSRRSSGSKASRRTAPARRALTRTAAALGTAEAVAGLGTLSVSWRWPTATPPELLSTSPTPSTSSATWRHTGRPRPSSSRHRAGSRGRASVGDRAPDVGIPRCPAARRPPLATLQPSWLASASRSSGDSVDERRASSSTLDCRDVSSRCSDSSRSGERTARSPRCCSSAHAPSRCTSATS